MNKNNTGASSSKLQIPAKGFAGLKTNWKNDLIAGFSVSLIALPLCLGISLASGVPPIAGVFTAIVGGLFASRISGSNVTISGPAAGLIATTLAAVESLGGGDNAVGYPLALAAIMIAGILVTGFGLLKVGKLGDFFPSAAVHGMLAAIGIIIIIKQSFVALGVAAPKAELIEVAMHLPKAFMELNPEIAVIAALSLVILIVYPMIDNKWVRMVPAPMWVLLATVPLSFAFDLFDEHHYHFAGYDYIIGPKYLVNLPEKLGDAIVFPDFSKLGTGVFWIAVTSFALVSGLESLLSAKAVDTLDPFKRKSNLDRDLMAMGGGSALASMIGGLPMISEIVRSSANINNGGRTQWANFFHAAFLLLFILLLKPLIMMIPLAALAAMLIFTGFRLASPKEFKHMAQIGWKQVLVFVATIVVVIASDLLIGIAVGILLELILNMLSGANVGTLVKAKTDTQVEGETCRIMVHQSAVFTNYLSLKKAILQHGACKTVTLDFEDVRIIDHTVMSNLVDMQADFKAEGRELRLLNLEHLRGITNHPLAPRSMRKNAPESLLKGLSRRQLEMMVYAVSNKLDYLPEEYDEHQDWEPFPMLTGQNIESVRCVFVKKGAGFRITIADLALSTGALLTLEGSERTVMRIDFNSQMLPRFELNHETPMDRVAERLGAQQDIDFVDFPNFSQLFLLQGADEAAICATFGPELLKFHEQNQEYAIESAGNTVLVKIKGRKLADFEEVEAMMAFGRGYAGLLAGTLVATNA